MINLLPPNVKQSVKFARINVTLMQYTAVALFAILGILSLMTFGKASLGNTERELERLIEADQVRIAELAPVNAEANLLSETVDTIDQLLDKEIKFSALLQEIGGVIPPGASLAGLTLSQDATQPISMSVLLDTAEKAGVLQENLIASDLFLSADILNVNRSNTEDGRYNFSANVQAYYNPELPLSSIDDQATEDAQ